MASYFDLRYRRIPNWLILANVPFVLGNLDRTIALILIAIALIAFILAKYVGAGDFKLAAVLASYSHILSWSQMWLYISLIFGGLYGLVLRKKSLPFAPFMTLGVLMIYLAQELQLI